MSFTKKVQESDSTEVVAALKSLPCHICRKLTDRETLMNRGAMCQGCFNHYCEHGASAQGRIGRGRSGNQS